MSGCERLEEEAAVASFSHTGHSLIDTQYLHTLPTLELRPEEGFPIPLASLGEGFAIAVV